MRRVAFWILFLVLSNVETKNVDITLEANWNGTPLVSEVAELVWKENKTSFWTFVESWDPKEAFHGSCWTALQDAILSTVTSEWMQKYFFLAMGFRLHSPKSIMRSRLAHKIPQSCCWIEIRLQGEWIVRTTLETLDEDLTKADVADDAVHDFDFEFGKKKGQALPLTILYAPIGSSCFHRFHERLKTVAAEERMRYVLRPAFEENVCATEVMHKCALLGTESMPELGGFGIEMAIKSTEYSAVNETESSTFEEPELDLKDLSVSNIGLQTTQHVLNAAAPFRELVDMVQNFPLHVSSLSKIEVDTSLEEAVRSTSRIVSFRQTFALLNGIPIDVEDFDFYPFLERIKTELHAHQLLEDLDIPNALIFDLLRLRVEDKTEELESSRFDILPKQGMVFLNDLERDPEYRTYYQSLEILFNPFVGGGWVPIRRNLFTVVYFVDLDSPLGRELAPYLVQALLQKLPMRMGIVPWLPSYCQTKLDSKGSASEELTRLFLELFYQKGPKEALAFWENVSRQPEQRSSIFASERKELAKQNAQDDDSVSNQIETYLKLVFSQMRRTGMCDAFVDGFLWINGRVVEIDPSTVERMTLYQIRLETQYLQKMLYVGKIEDMDRNLLKSILDNGLTFSKYRTHLSNEAPLVQNVLIRPETSGSEQVLVSNPNGTFPKSVTHWVMGNVASKEGLSAIRSALEFLMDKEGSDAQMIFHLSFGKAMILEELWRTVSLERKEYFNETLEFWIQLLSEEDVVLTLLESTALPVSLKEQISAFCKKVNCQGDVLKDQRELAMPELEFVNPHWNFDSDWVVVSNGRAFFPKLQCQEREIHSLCGSFTMEDFVILQKVASHFQLGRKIMSLLQPHRSHPQINTSQRTAIAASILKYFSTESVTKGKCSQM